MNLSRTFRASLLLAASLLAAAALAAPLAAQEQSRPRREQPAANSNREQPPVARLPADVTTRHVVEIGGRRLAFSATAGSIALVDAAGAPQAEIAYVAYRLEGAAPGERPLVFALNGGPGSASAWLHLGGLGPWRLDMAGGAVSPSAPPLLLPNEETWLDFADLVFIDPVGTGYSRFVDQSEPTRRHFFSVDGDIESLSVFVRRFVEAQGRPVQPRFIVGESYAGLRAPRMARRLQAAEAVGVDGLILVSPALDLRSARATGSALADAARLPTMAAVALEEKGRLDPVAMAAVEAYAAGDYLLDLLKGPRDSAAQARLAERVAALTGLDPAFVRERGGRVSSGAFRRARGRAAGRLASAYDATVTGLDPFPTADFTPGGDAFSDALATPLTTAMVDLIRNRLGWRPEGRYRLGNSEVNRAWNWGGGRGGPEAVGALAEALAADARLRVLAVHGYADLVTPYFETKLLFAQYPDFGGRLSLAVYPGGHMFYSRPGSRRDFRDAARALIAPP
ncbi:MAG: peptidase S10 [Methylobacteriaceae bacterium]|nr:peptidase S10 [Methylobacteriaceae bacterium]